MALTINALRGLPGITQARPMSRWRLLAQPNDTHYGGQWHLGAPAGIRAEQAWDHTVGDEDVVIGILDTGVFYPHLDIDPGDRSHVLPGIDTGDDDSDPLDDLQIGIGGGHGTAVAGVVGALRGRFPRCVKAEGDVTFWFAKNPGRVPATKEASP